MFIESERTGGVVFERAMLKTFNALNINSPQLILSRCENHENTRANLYVSIYEKMFRNKYGNSFPYKAKLFEFGVGPGEISREFENHGLNVFGTDIVSRKGGINIVSRNEIPFTNNAFDMVSVTSVLHHIPREEHDVYFSEFKRILKPDGIILMQEDERGRNKVEQQIIRAVDRMVSGPEADSHRTDDEWRKYFEEKEIKVSDSDMITHELGPIRLNKLFYLLETQK